MNGKERGKVSSVCDGERALIRRPQQQERKKEEPKPSKISEVIDRQGDEAGNRCSMTRFRVHQS